MQDESLHSEEPPITVGPIRVDVARWWEVNVDDKTIRLTPVECKILYYLAVHANTVCTFNQIESSVFGYTSNEGAGASIVKSKIRRIRSLIEPDPMHPTYVLTIPEVGYMLVDHVHDETRE
jgi:DNA-binding response OmpR family regulator